VTARGRETGAAVGGEARRLVRGVVAWACLLVAACGDPAPADGDGTGATRGPATRPNVLLVTLDTLRPDRMGLYGHERDTTPQLDALGAESVVFDNAFANSSFTPPSHASILTSRFPSEHGLVHWSRALCDVPTAAELFADAGYRTLAISPLKTLFAIGLDRGFETTLQPPHRVETVADGEQILYLADAERINADVLPLLKGVDDERPFFAWLHYYDAHRAFARQGTEWARRYDDGHDLAVGSSERWYQLRAEPHKGKHPQRRLSPADVDFMIDRYDGGLAYLDTHLGALFDGLRDAGVFDETLVLVTADHGEVFAEHDEEWFSHDPHLVDENVRVPLLVRLPDGAHAGARVAEPVQGVDVLPTLLELAGLAPEHPGYEPAGLSLVPTFDGGRLPRDAVFADRQGADHTGEQDWPPARVLAERDRKVMLRTPTHKIIHNVDRGTVSLYAEGDEHDNLFDPDEALSERLFGMLRARREALLDCASTAAPVDPSMEAHLQALGYAGGPDVDLDALQAEGEPGDADGDGR